MDGFWYTDEVAASAASSCGKVREWCLYDSLAVVCSTKAGLEGR